MTSDPRATARADILAVRGGTRRERLDELAVEDPLEIRLRHSRGARRKEASLGLTMRTPGRDEELAAGLLVGEGIVHARDDLKGFRHGVDRDRHPDLNSLVAELAPGIRYDPASWQRATIRSSACGICGRATLDALRAHAPAAPRPRAGWIGDAALRGVPAALEAAQEVFSTTGGLHAAAWFDRDGAVREVREDVGRHNAVDKLIGAAFLAGRAPSEGGGLVVSGRAGYEILQKAAMAGIPFVAALGAPTSLAVELALEFGITLVGFLRQDGYNVYAAPGRISPRRPRKGITITRRA